MSESFDAYHDWLGIAPKDQPPNHYRLLGIDLYEDKAKVIDSAVDRQMAHLRTFQTGPRAKHCEELLNKVSAGRVTLLDPEKKAAYDAELRDVLDAKPARAPLQVAQTLPLDVSVPSATLSFDTPQVHSTSSRRRENQKKGPPRMALAVGALLLGAVALIAAITMMGGGEEQRAQQPTNRPVVKEPPVRPPKSVALNTETEPGETTPPTATAGNFDEPLDIEPPQSETTGAATTQQTTQQDEQPANDPANTAPENNTPPENDPALKNDEAAESTEVASGDESPPDDSPRNRLPNDEPEPVAVNPEKRLAIPATAALKTAKTEIRSVFDLKAANDVESRIKLTQQILTTAMEAGNDPATQYAMLEIARDMSVHLGDYATAERVIDEMDKRFDVDAIAMRSKAVIRAITAKVPTDKRVTTAHAAVQLARELHDADRYDEAKTIVTVVQRASGRLRDRELTLEAKQLATEIREAANHYEPAREAFATLKISPDDPAANTVAGKYLCFVKGEWKRGLPMLAKGNDAELKELAAREVNGVSDTKAQVALGEGWSNIAAKKENQNHYELLLRAAGWYRDALPSIKGLEKTRVQKRLEAIRERLVKAPGRKTKLENLAIGATADESSAYRGESAERATDGIRDMAVGRYWFAGPPGPAWMRVRFVAAHEIRVVRLLLPVADYGPRDYSLLAEQGGKEVRIANIVNNRGPGVLVSAYKKHAGAVLVTIKLPHPIRTKSLRLAIPRTASTKHGPMVYEMEVIGIKTETWPELISRLKKRSKFGSSVKVENLARIGTYTCSSQAGANGATERAFDGSLATKMGQYWFSGHGPLPAWLRVQFPSRIRLHSIRMLIPHAKERFSGGHEPLDYSIFIERNGKEVVAFQVRNGQSDAATMAPYKKGHKGTKFVTFELPKPVLTSAIRVHVTRTSGAITGPVIFELEAYGTK